MAAPSRMARRPALYKAARAAARRARARAAHVVALGLLALLLSSCLLISGEQAQADAQPTGGNMSSSFVSAEGVEERMVATNMPAASLNVIVIVELEEGELRIEALDPDG